jgi:hypothetical protein
MLVLPENLRNKLKEPLGALVDEHGLLDLLQGKKRDIVAVGDQVTFTLLKNDVNPKVCIVDYIVERRKYPLDMKERIQGFGKTRINVRNPPGYITDELWNAIESVYKNLEEGPFRIDIDGEEDLAALPAIYLAPQDVTVIYGLPNKGVVVVTVDNACKSKVKEILDRMM